MNVSGSSARAYFNRGILGLAQALGHILTAGFWGWLKRQAANL
jgi:hypothetical protein